MTRRPTPKTKAAIAYEKKHRWVMNGNIPGCAEKHYAMIKQLNRSEK
jgi:hypothetical protein